MSALALAMMLTGAVSLHDAQRRQRPPAPPRSAPAQGARANLGSYFSTDDYPAAALRREEQGTTSFRLDIGTNGRVFNCAVTHTSGSTVLDAATCRILRARARYTPALDGAGNPMIGSDSGQVTWWLPPDDPHERAGIPIPATMAALRAPFQSYVTARDYPAAALRARTQGVSRVHVVVDVIGRVIACDVDEGSGSAALDAAACRIARARARYAPARNVTGASVCDVDRGEIAWRLPPRGRRVPRAGPAAAAPTPIETQLTPGACPGRTP
jgi:TonB family protein